MFDFKNLIDNLFNNDSCYSCYSCCNNTNERNTIIIPAIPAKDNYIIEPITVRKNKYSDKDVKNELESLMIFNQSSSSSSSRRYPIPRQPLTS
jgi:hypothetical protein